jgi:hypothetical protein
MIKDPGRLLKLIFVGGIFGNCSSRQLFEPIEHLPDVVIVRTYTNKLY